MILNTKDKILIWLEKYDSQYKKNVESHSYEFIDIHDNINQLLLNELIKKDTLPADYFEKLKSEGHQYIINVNVIDGVNTSRKHLEEIPFQFHHVLGDFDLSINKMKSLKGCPCVLDGSFNCSTNMLKSLKYSPKIIKKSFDCSHNFLNTLEDGPENIGNDFSCANNGLTSLKGCPQYIFGYFDCSKNNLISLEYCPQSIESYFCFEFNTVKSLEFFPSMVLKNVLLNYNVDLLNYKKQSSYSHMSDDNFLDIRDFKFWQQFHLIEKAKKENSQLIDDLILNDNKLVVHRKKV